MALALRYVSSLALIALSANSWALPLIGDSDKPVVHFEEESESAIIAIDEIEEGNVLMCAADDDGFLDCIKEENEMSALLSDSSTNEKAFEDFQQKKKCRRVCKQNSGVLKCVRICYRPS